MSYRNHWSGPGVADRAKRARRRRDRPPPSRRLLSALAVDKIGAVYVWLAIIVVFTIWAPDTFPTLDTAKQILNTNAITGLAALSILIPLSARVFDLSFAYVMTLSGVVVAKLVTHGTPLGLAIAAGLLVGVGHRPDQRRRRRRREDRLVHRDPGHRIADPRPDHDGHQRHAGLERGARRQFRQDRPDHDQRGHAARDLHAGGRPRDLVPARAHGDGTAPVRHRLQPGRRAARRRARRTGCASFRS